MVTPDPDGDEPSHGQLLRDSDLRKLELACSSYLHRVGTTEPTSEAFARLVQTLARFDPPLEIQILRRWGVR